MAVGLFNYFCASGGPHRVESRGPVDLYQSQVPEPMVVSGRAASRAFTFDVTANVHATLCTVSVYYTHLTLQTKGEV